MLTLSYLHHEEGTHLGAASLYSLLHEVLLPFGSRAKDNFEHTCMNTGTWVHAALSPALIQVGKFSRAALV